MRIVLPTLIETNFSVDITMNIIKLKRIHFTEKIIAEKLRKRVKCKN